ncbi:MAG: HU family DNA-binding protein [Leptospirales bacterium]
MKGEGYVGDRAKLFQRLVRQFPGVRREDARIIIDLFIEAIMNGNTIELRDFGVLRVRKRSARKGRNPRTGKKIEVATTKIPYFKLGKILKSRMNNV